MSVIYLVDINLVSSTWPQSFDRVKSRFVNLTAIFFSLLKDLEPEVMYAATMLAWLVLDVQKTSCYTELPDGE